MTIQLREEIAEQHRALAQIKEMAAKYGYDISGPATSAQEAVQWTYFGYLAAVKSQNGAAMSFGRASTFLDVFIERDIKAGKLTEEQAQELIDHLVMKLRMVRFLRTPEYDELFSGDPIWATESRRYGRRRPYPGHSPKQLPLPEHPVHHGAVSGAERDHSVV